MKTWRQYLRELLCLHQWVDEPTTRTERHVLVSQHCSKCGKTSIR